jgi:ParB family chromosome partitioning protein
MKIPLEYIDLPAIDLRATIDDEALDELADSLRDRGQLQSIGIRPVHPELYAGKTKIDPRENLEGFLRDGGRFEVVYGARRFRAATLLSWSHIRAEIAEKDSDADTAADKLIENVQRQDLTPIEEAYGLLELIGDGERDIRKLQRQTGKGRSWIMTRLDLVDMPDDLQGAVQAGVLSIAIAREFATIENQEIREQYTRHAVENGCTADLARVWASQARSAVGGLLAVDELATREEMMKGKPQVVDQQYDCFICATTNSWRRVNTLVVCGDCQDAVISSRHTSAPDPPSTPVDIPQNGA